MSDLGTLSMVLTAKTGLFTAGMAKANAALGAFTKATAVARGAAFKFMAVIGPVIGVGGFALMTRNALNSIDATAKLADRLGTTTEAITGLGHAADLAGVSSESFNAAMEILVRRLGEAKQGSGEMMRAVKTMGLDIQRLTNQDPAQTFVELADQIAKMPTAAQKAAAAYQLFGRSGMLLVNMLAEGSEGLREQMEEARKLGLTYDRVDAKKVEEANDALTRVKASFVGIFNVAAIQLAPVIEAVSKSFTDWATDGTTMAEYVVKSFGWVAMAVGKVGDAVHLIHFGFKWLGVAALKVATSIAEAFLWVLENVESVYNEIAKTKLGSAIGMEEVDFSSLARSVASGLASVTRVAEDDLQKFASQELPSDKIELFFKKIERAAKKLREEMARNAEAAVANAQKMQELEAYAKVGESIEVLNKKLRESIATFGMSAEQIEMWKIEQEAAKVSAEYQSDLNEQLAESTRLLAQYNAMKKQAEDDTAALREWEDMMKERRQWVQEQKESLKTPLDVFKEYRDKLETFIWEGALDPSQYQELVRRKWEELGLGKKTERQAGQFQTFDTRLVDLKALSIGQDPVVAEVKKSNEHLSGISDTLRLLLDTQAPLT